MNIQDVIKKLMEQQLEAQVYFCTTLAPELEKKYTPEDIVRLFPIALVAYAREHELLPNLRRCLSGAALVIDTMHIAGEEQPYDTRH